MPLETDNNNILWKLRWFILSQSVVSVSSVLVLIIMIIPCLWIIHLMFSSISWTLFHSQTVWSSDWWWNRYTKSDMTVPGHHYLVDKKMKWIPVHRCKYCNFFFFLTVNGYLKKKKKLKSCSVYGMLNLFKLKFNRTGYLFRVYTLHKLLFM